MVKCDAANCGEVRCGQVQATVLCRVRALAHARAFILAEVPPLEELEEAAIVHARSCALSQAALSSSLF